MGGRSSDHCQQFSSADRGHRRSGSSRAQAQTTQDWQAIAAKCSHQEMQLQQRQKERRGGKIFKGEVQNSSDRCQQLGSADCVYRAEEEAEPDPKPKQLKGCGR